VLKHGGNLQAAARRFGIPAADWLDLSTGVNPNGRPVSSIDAIHWQRLPEAHDGLEEAAARYYGAVHLLPVAGSQAAIQLLPQIRPESVVAVIEPAYAEHAHAWRQHGHQVSTLAEFQVAEVLPHLDVLVVVNPNNPTGMLVSPETLLDWHRQLSQKGGWLIVDEAFMDTTPEYSLAQYSERPGLIILRSIGKFFGLAGARCGFVLGEAELLDRLAEQLGPWNVSGPTRAVVRQALADDAWQATTRTQLRAQGRRLYGVLSRYGLAPHGGTALFQWLEHDRALEIHEALGEQAILTRYFSEPCSLRFGLPGTEQDWQRLEQALALVMQGGLQTTYDEDSHL